MVKRRSHCFLNNKLLHERNLSAHLEPFPIWFLTSAPVIIPEAAPDLMVVPEATLAMVLNPVALSTRIDFKC